MYILYALAGFAILAVVSLLDKFILAKKASVLTYTFYVSVFSLALAVCLPFGMTWPGDFLLWGLLAADALFFFFGLMFLFKAIAESEISHIGPLVGAMVPFFTVFISWLFLGELLSGRQLAGISFLIAGSLAISFEKSQRHNGLHIGMLWGALAGLWFAISHALSKYLYGALGFYSGIILIRLFLGLFGLALLVWPSVRREVLAAKAAKTGDKLKTARGSRMLVGLNMVLGIGGVLLVQYAISLGSVSVVNALEGARYGLLVILVAILSRLHSKFLREYYSSWEKWQEAGAVALIGVGLGLLI